MSKTVTLILGAGFSHSMTMDEKLPLAKDLSSQIKESLSQNQYFESSDFQTWLTDYNHESHDWSFEELRDLLKFLQTLKNNKYPDPVVDSDMELANKIIIAGLYQKLFNFELNLDLAEKLKQYIDHFISEGYTVNVFDLNFDSVFEEIFKGHNEYNDFFGTNYKSYEFDDLTRIKATEPFKQKRIESNRSKLNHYKIHGALDIFNLEKFLPPNDPKREETIFGFYKLAINQEDVDRIINHGSLTPMRINSGFSVPCNFSFVTGNTSKLIGLSYSYDYSLFCYKELKESLDCSDLILISGYSAKDPEIKTIWNEVIKDSSLIQDTKTHMVISESLKPSKNLFNIFQYTSSNPNFEDFLLSVDKYESLF